MSIASTLRNSDNNHELNELRRVLLIRIYNVAFFFSFLLAASGIAASLISRFWLIAAVDVAGFALFMLFYILRKRFHYLSLGAMLFILFSLGRFSSSCLVWKLRR